MAIVAMVILAVLIFLLTGTKKLFVTKASLRTYMDDSAALAVGAPVRLNGIIIGNVTRVGLSGEKIPRRVVRIDMSVDASMLSRIPVDSQAAISAENVLGTKFINIKMGQSAETVRDGAEIPSKDVSEFEEVVQSGYDVMVAARDLLRRIDGVVRDVEDGRGTIGKLLVDEELYKRLTGTVAEAQKVTQAISSGQGTVGRLLYDESLYNEVRSTVQRLDEIVQNVQEGQGTAGKLLRDPSLYDDARKAVAELNKLVEDLNAGKGTAGKLLKDEELHRQIQTTLARLEDTVEKLNNGQGTLGQLMVNPQLYESLNGVSRELEALLKDFRANPRKFLRIKLALF
ncbi:MAG: MlaD family protein [Bryobacteraceae bacterium]|nr:MlaD family protein [Bryobacteraceae bacterium]